jgi:proteasome lid subunit RPN8/RPN11
MEGYLMLVLPREREASIRGEGEAAYPNECCGALMGEIDRTGTKFVKRTLALRNAREDSEQYHRFLITPEDMFQAERTARDSKLEIVGFYHSHPDHPPAPSGYDNDHALPFYSYVIVSVAQGVAEALTSWELATDGGGLIAEKIIKEGP